MPRSVQRQLPVQLTPHDYETVESFTTRLCRENNLEVKIEAIAAEIRNHDKIPIAAARRRLACEFGGLLEDSDLFLSPLRHDDGSECSRCRMGLEDRWACRLCANGEAIEQIPHFGPFVCPKHRIWIGPGAKSAYPGIVDPSVSIADETLQRLVDKKRVDGSVLTEVSEIVDEWSSGVGELRSPIDLFPAVVAVLNLVTDPGFHRDLLDRTKTFAESYALLTSAIGDVCAGETAALVDRIWLLLRPLFKDEHDRLSLALVRRTLEPHDLHAAAATTTVVLPLEPFRRFNEVMVTCAPSKLIHELRARTSRAPMTTTLTKMDLKTTAMIKFICPQGHHYVSSAKTLNKALERGTSGCQHCRASVPAIYPGEISLATRAPFLLTDWEWDANEGLDPERLSIGDTVARWRCRAGHAMEQRIQARWRARGCVTCRARTYKGGRTPGKSKSGGAYFLDLAPALLSEFKPQNNGMKTLDGVRPSSSKRFVWECHAGHRWTATCNTRWKGHNCPYCANKKVWSGFNDLATKDPTLAAIWDHDANGLSPSEVLYTTTKKYYWKCKLGHSYRSAVDSRRKASVGCPYCTGRRLLVGFNTLADRFPAVARELDMYLNPFTAQEVAGYSSKTAIFRCPRGHLYLRMILTRTHKGMGCTVCTPRRPAGEALVRKDQKK